LRESARRLLIRAHLASGNRALAASEVAEFRRDLARDLGIEPSPEILREVQDGMDDGYAGDAPTPIRRRARP
jgi:DNA-binding SARP family transcriptional activator